jgi:hypothetical protein
MTPQQYLESIGLGHLCAPGDWATTGPGAVVTLAPGITLTVEPDTDDTFGGVWLSVDGRDLDGQTPAEAEAALDRMGRGGNLRTRYRAALAVLRGEAPQPEETDL